MKAEVFTGRIRRECTREDSRLLLALKVDRFSFLPIFVDVNFDSFALTRNGFTIGLSVRAPPKARARKSEYWGSKAGLSKGHLVALVWNEQVSVGTVTSSRSYIPTNLKPSETDHVL